MEATNPTTKNVREVSRVVTAHKQKEGGGFIVRRPFPVPRAVLLSTRSC